MMSIDCSPDVILIIVLIKYAKTSYIVPFDYIGIVSIKEKLCQNACDIIMSACYIFMLTCSIIMSTRYLNQCNNL